MNMEEALKKLNNYWEPDGLLMEVRNGYFRKEEGDEFLDFLSKIDTSECEVLPKKPVSGLPLKLGKNTNELIYQGTLRNNRHGVFEVKTNEK